MFSEWMTELPEDFEEEWLMVVCPTGKRNLVLAQEGETVMQSKNGILQEGFRSLLPGGNPDIRKDMTIVDTIFNKKLNTFFVLDVLYWKEQDLTSCETDLRFFWLTTRMSEINGLDNVSKMNPHKFVALKNYPCTKEGITEGLKSVEYEVDGLLFFRKKFGYIAGTTETVLWLKPYMLPELLEVEVPEALMAKKPASYTSFAEHSEKVIKNQKERKERESKRRGYGRRQKQAPIDIDQLVNDISELYISKKLGLDVKRDQGHGKKTAQGNVPKGGKSKGGKKGQKSTMQDYSNLRENQRGYYDDWGYYDRRGYYDGWDEGYYNEEAYRYGNRPVYDEAEPQYPFRPAYDDYLEETYSPGYQAMHRNNMPYSVDDLGYMGGMRGVNIPRGDRYREYMEPEMYRGMYNDGVPMAAGRGGLLSALSGRNAGTPAMQSRLGGLTSSGWEGYSEFSAGQGGVASSKGGKSPMSAYKRTHKMFKH